MRSPRIEVSVLLNGRRMSKILDMELHLLLMILQYHGMKSMPRPGTELVITVSTERTREEHLFTMPYPLED